MAQDLIFSKPANSGNTNSQKLKEAMLKYLNDSKIPFAKNGPEISFVVKYSGSERFFLLRWDSKYKRYNLRFGKNRDDAESETLVDAKIIFTSEIKPIIQGVIDEFKESTEEDLKNEEIRKDNLNFKKEFSKVMRIPEYDYDRNRNRKNFELNGSEERWNLKLSGLSKEEILSVAYLFKK